MIDKSNALMPWGINCALEICAEAIKPETLYSDIYLEQIWKIAKRAHKEAKKEAADVGTASHKWLEAYFKQGAEPPLPEDERVWRCTSAALNWLKEHDVQPVAIEKKIYSRKYRYSGTLDKLALVDGKLALIDWKTSRGIYPSHKLQTAAYVAAYEEETKIKVNQRFLIQLGKEDGEFNDHKFNRADQEADFKAFLGALELYEWLH